MFNLINSFFEVSALHQKEKEVQRLIRTVRMARTLRIVRFVRDS